MQQQQDPTSQNKVNTSTPYKHNALLFCLIDITQFILVIVVLCSCLQTTELRGSFYYDDKTNVNGMILKPDGNACEHFIIYKAETSPQEQWDERLLSSGYATMKDDVKSQDNNKNPSSGRILTVLERSMKVTSDEGNSSTGELKMRISLLFEWKTGHDKLDNLPDDVENQTERLLQESSDIDTMNVTLINMTSTVKMTSTDKTTGITESLNTNKAYSVEKAYAKKTKQPTIDDQQIPWPRRPNGSHAYKFNKMEGVQNNQPDDANVFDPFKYVAVQLLVFSLLSFLQMIILLCRCVFSDNNGHYSMCELLSLMLSLVIWGIILTKAAVINMNWDSIWMCTNFKPEKPNVFVVTVICSSVLVVLFLFEALYACEMMFDESAGGGVQKEVKQRKAPTTNSENNNNVVVAAASPTDTSTSILLPFTVPVQQLGGNIQQAKLTREDFCMITVKEN